MDCFVNGDRNGTGCFVNGDRNGTGCFARVANVAWTVLSMVTEMARDVLSMVTEMARDVLPGWQMWHGLFCQGCKIARDVFFKGQYLTLYSVNMTYNLKKSIIQWESVCICICLRPRRGSLSAQCVVLRWQK